MRKRARDRLLVDGKERGNPNPKFVPVPRSSDPQRDHIRALIRSELLNQAVDAQEHDTFEEADDFDIGDDYDPTSPYEEQFDPEPLIPKEEEEELTKEEKKEFLSQFREFISSKTSAETEDSPESRQGEGDER